jgi:hypothetical protein
MNLIKSLLGTSKRDSKSIALRGNKAIKNVRNTGQWPSPQMVGNEKALAWKHLNENE